MSQSRARPPLPSSWSYLQAKHVHAHLEAARSLYNALLSEANKRLRRMRNDPSWQVARAIPHTHKQERAQAFSHLRRKYHFSEYELHEYVKRARVAWITDHIDSTMAQTLATRAYQAVNRVCVGKAKKVRFRSRGRGIDSVQGKRNDVGMRFVLDPGVGGRSIGLRAPGMFVAHLERLVAKTGGTLNEISAFKTKLSQYCHGCGQYVKKPRSQRWHVCPCGLLPVQRDLYSAFLLACLDPTQTIPSISQSDWEGAEPRLHAEIERLRQRASEGQILHRSMGVVAAHSAPRARARRQQSPANPHQELALLIKKQEAVGVEQEPPCLEAGEVSVSTI